MRRVHVGVAITLAWAAVVALLGPAWGQAGPMEIAVSPGGHYLTVNGETRVLVGDSGTQCVMQNANLDYRQWIDDCSDAGLNAVHIWSFTPARQRADGSVVEKRYGYVYPDLTPWARREGGPMAADGRPQWDLTRFDEGAGPGHYWSRLRDLCSYASRRGLVVGITVFFGWPKHQSDWEYHPLNAHNGGPVEDTGNPVTQVQIIESPGTEVLAQPWAEEWPAPRKTQWIWERFADKLIRDTQRYGNVFFVFMDEHSYSEGNCGDHFAEFFRSRGALWCDWEPRRGQVDLVMGPTLNTPDKNPDIVRGFVGEPPRPYVFLEGPPYRGEEVREDLWSVLLGGGHFFFHNDAEQETPQTGIMGYDPHVIGGDVGAERRGWLGQACRFLNGEAADLDRMAPHNELAPDGGYCLASPGREYFVYVPVACNPELLLDVSEGDSTIAVQVLEPSTGEVLRVTAAREGRRLRVRLPFETDQVVHALLER